MEVFITGGTGYIGQRLTRALLERGHRAGLTATILRPWYVLGPGHRWPVVLKPLYALLELRPSTRERARRLGLVTIDR